MNEMTKVIAYVLQLIQKEQNFKFCSSTFFSAQLFQAQILTLAYTTITISATIIVWNLAGWTFICLLRNPVHLALVLRYGLTQRRLFLISDWFPIHGSFSNFALSLIIDPSTDSYLYSINCSNLLEEKGPKGAFSSLFSHFSYHAWYFVYIIALATIRKTFLSMIRFSLS